MASTPWMQGGENVAYGTGATQGLLNQALQPMQYAQGLQNQKDIANIGAQAQMYPATLAMQRFNTVFPWAQGQFGSLSQQLLGRDAGGAGAGPAGGGGPAINAGPVWNPAQVQQQVNTGVAANDAKTGSNIRGAAQGLAGRGFGGQSPLLAELGAQYQGQGLQANAAARQAIPWQAAQGNAQQQLAGQQAQEAQYAARQGEQIRRAQIAQQAQSSLFAALAGMV